MNFPKFFPRLQKFLTENPCYTSEKKSIELNFLRRTQVIFSIIKSNIFTMKKRKFKTLQLNKKRISAMNQNMITGGGSADSGCCQEQSYGTCDKEKQLTPGCDHH